jgi:hypothetical protein
MSGQRSDSDNKLAEILQAESTDSFSPYFVDRVMKAIGSSSMRPEGVATDSLYDALRWMFVRAAVASIVLIIAVGLMNAFEFEVVNAASWVDTMLGLPSDELADMLTYEMI